MATYEQIQNWVREKYGFTVKTCWIADVKEKCGLPPRRAPNRNKNGTRLHPCPKNKIASIKDAFRHFSMI